MTTVASRPVQSQDRVLVYEARALNAARSEYDTSIAPRGSLRAAWGIRQEKRGLKSAPKLSLIRTGSSILGRRTAPLSPFLIPTRILHVVLGNVMRLFDDDGGEPQEEVIVEKFDMITQVPLPEAASCVAAGANHSLAVSSDGRTVWGWGAHPFVRSLDVRILDVCILFCLLSSMSHTPCSIFHCPLCCLCHLTPFYPGPPGPLPFASVLYPLPVSPALCVLHNALQASIGVLS